MTMYKQDRGESSYEFFARCFDDTERKYASFSRIEVQKMKTFTIHSTNENPALHTQILIKDHDGKSHIVKQTAKLTLSDDYDSALHKNKIGKGKRVINAEDDFYKDLLTLISQAKLTLHAFEAFALYKDIDNSYKTPLKLSELTNYRALLKKHSEGLQHVLFPFDNILNQYINITYDDLDIKELERTIRKIARTPDELRIYKTIIAWTIANMFKVQLIAKKFSIYPPLILIGPKGCGKSTALACFTNVGIRELFSTSINLRKATLKNMPNMVFPLFFDELKVIDARTTDLDLLKAAFTSGYMNILNASVSGKPGEGWEINLLNPIAIATNELNITDDAMRSRLFEISYPDIDMTGWADLEGIQREMPKFYKYVFEQLAPKYADKWFATSQSYKQLYDELFAPFEVSQANNRHVTKMMFVNMGDKILHDLDFLTDVKVWLTELDNENTVDIADMFKREVRKLISSISMNDRGNKFTMMNAIHTKKWPDELIQALADKGIYCQLLIEDRKSDDKERMLYRIILAPSILAFIDKSISMRFKNFKSIGFEKSKRYAVMKQCEPYEYFTLYGTAFSVDELLGEDADEFKRSNEAIDKEVEERDKREQEMQKFLGIHETTDDEEDEITEEDRQKAFEEENKSDDE